MTTSVLTATTFIQHSLGLLPIGTSKLPAHPLERLGDDLVEVFAEMTNTTITPLTSMFVDEPAWRAFFSDALDDDGRRFWVVVAPTRFSIADVQARLLLEVRVARFRIEELDR